MANYRRLLVVVALVGLSAGCVGFLTGSQALEFSANRTVASDAALQETGYQEANNQTVTNVVRVGAAGQERQVNLTSYLSVYNRTVDASDLNESQIAALGGPDGTRLPEGGPRTPPGAASGDGTDVPLGNTSSVVSFSVLAMPNARVAGESVHPLSRVSTERLVRRFAATENTTVRFEGNHTVSSLGDERTVSTFRLETGPGGVDALVHVASFDAGNDYVVTLAVHPALIDERDRIDALVAGLEQPFV
jgi:hypothetical protein